MAKRKDEETTQPDAAEESAPETTQLEARIAAIEDFLNKMHPEGWRPK